MITIKKGLNLPIAGVPVEIKPEEKVTQRVALLGRDYHGLKPQLTVKVGDEVSRGSTLFVDKKNTLVRWTSPITGKISAIRRGERRKLLAVEVERSSRQHQEKFPSYTRAQLQKIKAENIVEVLLKSGLWTALRTRPFSKVPAPIERPHNIFVNVMDTNPLAVSPAFFIADYRDDLKTGIQLLERLSQEKVFVCKAADMELSVEGKNIEVRSFAGKHPAGLSGTHMHFLSPVGRGRTNWVIHYQDAAAIGNLFTQGELMTERMISLAGPQARKPRPVRTSLGADLVELTDGEMLEGDNRIISGSIFHGYIAEGQEAFLGRHHLQVSLLARGAEREFMGWLSPGLKRFSTINIYLSKWFPQILFNFTTTTNGSPRAMMPIGNYETMMPLDILPTQLLRALVVGDIEAAENLGCLELDEEDLALCTFVCPSKYEYGDILRHNLELIEKENWG